MPNKRGPLALIIIDGWGYSPFQEGNAIALAETPYYDELTENYPLTYLEAHGTRVSLPAGVMGNSEVGHLNIRSGASFVWMSRASIMTSRLRFQNEVLVKAMDGAKRSKPAPDGPGF